MTIRNDPIEQFLDQPDNSDSLPEHDIGPILAETIPQPSADFQQKLGQQLLSVLETRAQTPEPVKWRIPSKSSWWSHVWKSVATSFPQAKIAVAGMALILVLALAYLATLPPDHWQNLVYEVMNTTERLDKLATARGLASATPTTTPTLTNTPPLSAQTLGTAVVTAPPVALIIPVPLPIATPSQ